ncbi:MAG: Type 1 glutamine amidotransferase-like domain-containing protein [Candidatus Pacebacteria bacterium]|nr:Type 1 glutamine amidotransferase-like domain-containing protein [Candidatus Paceibacterota bacterium]
MKYYLSSYEFGDKTEKLKTLALKGKIGYIPNARDFTNSDQERKAKRTVNDMNSLRELGLEVELLNLQDYFGKRDELKKKLEQLGAIFISGGNVFILRQAMKLSGLDEILKELQDTDFLYAGYSAAGCVLAPSLKGMDIVDPLDTPYAKQREIIWGGLGFVDFHFMPHWNSDHPESADVEKEIAYCKENNIPYKAIRDGEVIIIE